MAGLTYRAVSSILHRRRIGWCGGEKSAGSIKIIVSTRAMTRKITVTPDNY